MGDNNRAACASGAAATFARRGPTQVGAPRPSLGQLSWLSIGGIGIGNSRLRRQRACRCCTKRPARRTGGRRIRFRYLQRRAKADGGGTPLAVGCALQRRRGERARALQQSPWFVESSASSATQRATAPPASPRERAAGVRLRPRARTALPGPEERPPLLPRRRGFVARPPAACEQRIAPRQIPGDLGPTLRRIGESVLVVAIVFIS